MAGGKGVAYVAKRILGPVGATTAVPGTTYPGISMWEAATHRNWTILVYGITTATVTIWGCIDEAVWQTLDVSKGQYLTTSATALWAPLIEVGTNGVVSASGIYTFGTNPLLDIAASVTSWSSGTITVQVMAV